MADLDTRSKRASAISALRPYMIAPPLPDGTIEQGDRQHIAWMYSGILSSVEIVLVLSTERFIFTITPRRLEISFDFDRLIFEHDYNRNIFILQ